VGETAWLKIAEMILSRNTNFWLITTIILIIYIGFSKAKKVFCTTNNEEKCEKNNGTCENLSKKDYIYLAVMMIILSVILTSLALYTDDEAMQLFSFASTITSIILSVIAIIMTITSEEKNASSKEKLEKSAEKIENATKMLGEVANNFDPSLLKNIDNKTEKLKKLMDDAIIKIESAEANARAAKENTERYLFEGDPGKLKVNIPDSPKEIQISSDKYKRRDQ